MKNLYFAFLSLLPCASSFAGTLDIVSPLSLSAVVAPTPGYGAELFHLFDLNGKYLGHSNRYLGDIFLPEMAAGEGICSIGLIYGGSSVDIIYDRQLDSYFYHYARAEIDRSNSVPFSVFYQAGMTNNARGTDLGITGIQLDVRADRAAEAGTLLMRSVYCAVSVKQGVEPDFKEILESALGKYLTLKSL